MTEDVRSAATRLMGIDLHMLTSPMRMVEFCTDAQQVIQGLLTVVADLSQQIAQQETEIAAITAKERREFAWAEEYMAKARSLELKLEHAEATLAQQARGKLKKLEATMREAAEAFGRKSLSLDRDSGESAATAAAAVLLRDLADQLLAAMTEKD